MADSRLAAEWSQTGEILAMLMNTRMGNTKVHTVADFSPYHAKQAAQIQKISFDQAMKRFPGGQT